VCTLPTGNSIVRFSGVLSEPKFPQYARVSVRSSALSGSFERKWPTFMLATVALLLAAELGKEYFGKQYLAALCNCV